MKTYRIKLGRLPPTEVWRGYDTGENWDPVERATENRREFEDDDPLPEQ